MSHQIANLAREDELEFLPLGMTRDRYFARRGHALHGVRAAQRGEILSWPTTIAFPPEARPRRHAQRRRHRWPSFLRAAPGISSPQARCRPVSISPKTPGAVLIHNDILSDYLAGQDLLPKWIR